MDFTEILSIVIGSLGIISYLLTFRKDIFNNGSNDRNLSDRVTTLEKQFSDVASDIKTIKENHLSHIQADIYEINVNLSKINTTLEFLQKKKK